MEDVIRIIEHLLETQYSIDRIDTIVNQLNISKDYLFKIINDDLFKDYFQLLHPSNNRGSEKLALTLDLFCCTHYAQHCRNQLCPFLHLCPYNVRPMHTKCTNKTCQLDHDILKSVHNRRIIDAHGLSYIPARILHEVIRASADPIRSFSVCTDYGKKSGCSKRNHCDRLHYCYYSLIDNCTKPHCQHVINDECLTYFRQKEINEQDSEDILNAFRKVLRQRKSDYISINNASSGSSSPKNSTPRDNQRKPKPNQQRGSSSSSKRSTPMMTTGATTISSYDDVLSSGGPDPPSPSPNHIQDILLEDNYDRNEYAQVQRYLTNEIGCPVKLLTTKQIYSDNKNNQNSNAASKPIYYYYPTKNPDEIFPLLRWQNKDNSHNKSLIAYASLRDAHDLAKQNFENNQFCIIRIHIFHSGIANGKLLTENRLEITNPLTMCFDRMWIYIYDL